MTEMHEVGNPFNEGRNYVKMNAMPKVQTDHPPTDCCSRLPCRVRNVSTEAGLLGASARTQCMSSTTEGYAGPDSAARPRGERP
mmetsp:Transcript_36713/g.85426  ORF Transcript_36713/g.85426 Transcript_36713/m.85426 type:complete len:84 (-) Transcript_36713:323-574(-)